MSWEVIVSPEANKRIAKLSVPDKRRILIAIAELHEGLNGDIKPLKGREDWRMRVGKWRLLLSVDAYHHIIEVVSVDTRGDVYKH